MSFLFCASVDSFLFRLLSWRLSHLHSDQPRDQNRQIKLSGNTFGDQRYEQRGMPVRREATMDFLSQLSEKAGLARDMLRASHRYDFCSASARIAAAMSPLIFAIA